LTRKLEDIKLNGKLTRKLKPNLKEDKMMQLRNQLSKFIHVILMIGLELDMLTNIIVNIIKKNAKVLHSKKNIKAQVMKMIPYI